jgi:glycosyltransferase involved in cell wall biosynthesis
MSVAPELLARGARPCFEALRQRPGFDLIDAHYFYPDGVAAALLARRAGVPLLITARGSDVNVIAEFPAARKRIVWAAQQSVGVIAVSVALKERMVRIGIPESRIHVMRNGVDTEFFRPVDRAVARDSLGFRETTLLSVGKLVEGKGHDIVVRALQRLPGTQLVIVGDGPMRRALERLVTELGLDGRVRFAGEITQEALREHYGAADVLVLASAREGMPNVVLEALACGTPVVATDVGGIAEVVTGRQAGVLLRERSPAAVADGVRALQANAPSRLETRRHAERYTWRDTTADLLRLLGSVTTRSARD